MTDKEYSLNPSSQKMRDYRNKKREIRKASGWTDGRRGPKPGKRKSPGTLQSNADAVKAWRITHPESARISDRVYKGMKRCTIFTDSWTLILGHYGGVCLACGGSNIIPEHVLPVLDDPDTRNVLANLQPLCRSCNSVKGAGCTDYRPDNGLWILQNIPYSLVPLHPCRARKVALAS